MKATFYVIGRSGKRATRATWVGGWYDGELALEAAADTVAHQQVLGIMDARPDLADVLFRSAGPRFTVPGWEGLEGNYGAMRIAVEAIGARLGELDVDDG